MVIDDLSIDAPKTKLFAQKLKGMGLEGNLLVVTDELNENLYLSSRNLPNVLVLEAQEADPVSLVRFNKVLVTKNAVAKVRGDVGMNQERLMQVLLAPQISERLPTLPTRTSRWFSVSHPMRPSRKSRLLSNCCSRLRVGSVQIANVKGKVKAFKGATGRRKGWKRPM